MKRIIMAMMAAVALLLLSSCSESKESYVKDFTKFVEKVQADADSYTDADWEKMNKKYVDFAETKYEKYSSELSTDEMLELTKLKAAYITIQAKHGIINSLLKEGNKALDKIKK